jgi:hypothetical protein
VWVFLSCVCARVVSICLQTLQAILACQWPVRAVTAKMRGVELLDESLQAVQGFAVPYAAENAPALLILQVTQLPECRCLVRKSAEQSTSSRHVEAERLPFTPHCKAHRLPHLSSTASL